MASVNVYYTFEEKIFQSIKNPPFGGLIIKVVE